MGPMDYIVIALIALIIGGAVVYIIREKKRGKACIGCPYCDSCHQKGGGSSKQCGGCGGSADKKDQP